MKKLVLFFCISLLPLWAEPQKIVYLVSPPRSLSVGFLRMMEARGDFKIYHEPTISPYHQAMGFTFSKDWFKPGAFQTFDEVKESLFKENSNVFVKEMSFSLEMFLDEDLTQRPNVYFIFLLRDPHSTVVSLYKKIIAIVNDLSEVKDFEEAIGYEAAYNIYQKIIKAGARQPLVLLSEDLAASPKEIVQQVCDYVEIPWKEEALNWENLGSVFDGQEEWHEGKRDAAIIQHWHGDAIRSTQFQPLGSYDVDSVGTPTFHEVRNQDRERCKKVYSYSLPFYNFFRELPVFISIPCAGRFWEFVLSEASVLDKKTG